MQKTPLYVAISALVLCSVVDAQASTSPLSPGKGSPYYRCLYCLSDDGGPANAPVGGDQFGPGDPSRDSHNASNDDEPGTNSTTAIIRPTTVPKGFDWVGAINQSTAFLFVEHGFRLTQRKTRAALGGPYWRDYANSVRGVCCRWGDGDSAFTSYVAHPMQGAVAGYIQIQNDPKGMRLEFEHSREYWVSRLKATGWSALYSTQFEIGPFLSEASIGNVGLKPGTSGFVDFVTTPAGGFGFILLEDWIDKKWIRKRELAGDSVQRQRWWRMLLNPNRTFANLMRAKVPWHRDTRPSPSEPRLSLDQTTQRTLSSTAGPPPNARSSSPNPSEPADDGTDSP